MTDEHALDMIRSALFEVAPKRKADFESLQLDQKIEDLALDSIATMEMVGYLEDNTESTFPDEELAKVRTVRNLVSLVTVGRVA